MKRIKQCPMCGSTRIINNVCQRCQANVGFKSTKTVVIVLFLTIITGMFVRIVDVVIHL